MTAPSLETTFPSPDNSNSGRNRDVSFSSYLNKSEEAFIRRLAAESNFPNIHPMKKQEEEEEEEDEDEDEIGVFSAEKYFSGGIDHENLIMTTPPPTTRIPQQKKMVVVVPTRSLKSESSSCNSQSILLMKSSSNSSWRRRKSSSRGKGLLYGLTCRCYCNDKDSVQVKEEQVGGEISFRGTSGKKKKNPIPDDDDDERIVPELISPASCHDLNNQQKQTCFSFPATSSTIKLKTQPMWAPQREEPDHENEGSDASSDLFEIESLTSGKATPFLARQTSDMASGCVTPAYPPSEASVEWSVVTASACAMDYFAVASDQEELRMRSPRTEKRADSRSRRRNRGDGTLSLMGCKSGEALRVANDAPYVIKRERAKTEAVVGGNRPV